MSMNDMMRQSLIDSVLDDTRTARHNVIQFWTDSGKELSPNAATELDSEVTALNELARKTAVINYLVLDHLANTMADLEAESYAESRGLVLADRESEDDDDDEK